MIEDVAWLLNDSRIVTRSQKKLPMEGGNDGLLAVLRGQRQRTQDSKNGNDRAEF